ncbi:CAP domain-containing protein [Streptomyces sp. NPDC087658]|uniref:CAP domain-containing protein n=1 Tax=Streptomyces sp. NPDC087658 TaxID=3365800 RepID=UPI0038264D46
MGRHGRSDESGAPADAPANGGAAAGRESAARRKGRAVKPVRTGLLGASAAMAVGAVAVASGLLPGGGQFTVSGGGATGEQIRGDIVPELQQQGGASAEPTDDASASPGAAPGSAAKKPAKEAAPAPAKPTDPPSKETRAVAITPKAKPSAAPSDGPDAADTAAGTASGSGAGSAADSAEAPAAGRAAQDRAAAAPAADASAAAEVLALVNKERAKVGCAAVRADASLDALAQSYSDDMAARGFFDHTDPDGQTPWDRADKAGVKDLGGENIARGQSTPEAVMESWMNSEGHRANILNCDFTRLGVGVNKSSGGPWWTQNFGF